MKQQISVVFTGDIGFDRYMSGKWTDEQLLDRTILEYFRSADHVVANVEAAVMKAEDNGSHGVFFHAMDPAATCVLEKIGADVWNISNNHIMDAGVEGLLNTRRLAAEMGARTIGAGINEKEASEPVYLEGAGGVGLIGVAYQAECIPATAAEPGVFRWDDLDYIARRIAQVKETCRWCVIVSHGGEEFAALPNPYTRDRYLKYLELGADAVVAHHPHVPENYELFPDGKAIFYSLGNFIFDTDYQRVHPYTDAGVLLRLTFTEEAISFDALGTQVLRGEERIAAAPLPAVFADVPAEEYEKLSPLSAAAFVHEERKKMIYLEPKRFTDAPKEVWDAYFFSDEPDGFAEGAHMDFNVMIPFAEKEKEGAWRQSRLEGVKQHILKQFE